MLKVICLGCKGNRLIAGYTSLSELCDRDDPELLVGASLDQGDGVAIREIAEELRGKGIEVERVRDYIDDRYEVVSDEMKDGLLRCFNDD